MADEIRGAREEVAATPAIRPRTMDPERQLPAEAEAAHAVPDYDDPEHARADIEATRARMSGTIDNIEDALVRKKEEIQHRFDIIAPVRENPWPSMGIALGAGLVLGLLTGGEDEEDEEDEERERHVYRIHAGASAADWERRAEILEERTQRLLAIARDQEEEIRRLRGKKKKRRDGKSSLRERVVDRVEEEYEDLSERAEKAGSRLDDLRHTVMDGLTSFLQDAFRELNRRR
jgi:ElaB/YqjD/DUF883 family membrane-anchored ribosome-binding protein